MELSYHRIKNNAIKLISLTGLKKEEFESLLITFEKKWDEYILHWTIEGKKRIRTPSYSGNGVVPKAEDKLFFILFYYKQYPIQELMGASFRMSQPQANTWIKLLEMILYKSLKEVKVIPERNGLRLKHVIKDGQILIIDGVERLIVRPSDDDEQKEHYSGKKRFMPSKTTS